MSEPTKEELLARIAELEKQAVRKRVGLEFKVSEKGGVSVYGVSDHQKTYFSEHAAGRAGRA